MSETLVTVRNVGKKFCRRLKHALWYGVQDLAAELTTRRNGAAALRTHEFWALRDVSFELKRGQTLGLIGPNGAGKTTLLRLLNGLIKPDEGRIEVSGRMQALIALGAGFNPVLTGRENIYVNAAVLGITRAEIDRRLDEIVEFSGLESFIDAPLQSYSSGMVVRLGFAVAAHLEPDVLLIDEVLAVGDEGFQSKCLNRIGKLRQKGTATILVSHNMHTIQTFSDVVLLANKGRYTSFEDVSEGIREYRRSFAETGDGEIQKIRNGNDSLSITSVDVESSILNPLDTITVSINYDSKTEYSDVEIDVTLYSSNERGLYFQATNRAFKQRVDIRTGRNHIGIQIHNVPIQNANVTLGVAIWTRRRCELLFWWRIPLRFGGMADSTGRNLLRVSYLV